MEILITSAGKQTGPHTEEEALALLRAGTVKLTDMAYRRGMPDVLPLHEILGLDPNKPIAAPATKAAPVVDAATARQKAFLTYMRIPFSADLTKEAAAMLVNDAMENPALAGRLKSWEGEKLKLYPDLFVDEVKARKENRAQIFLDISLAEGAEYFTDITKAHTQVLVAYLDVHRPHWDEHEECNQIFFAAVSEKFPQLVKKAARGTLHYPDGPKVSREIAGDATRKAKPKRSPLMAVARGVGLGLLILFAMYGAKAFRDQNHEVNHFLAQWVPLLASPVDPLAPGAPLVAEATPEPNAANAKAPVRKNAAAKKRDVAANPTPAPKAEPVAEIPPAPIPAMTTASTEPAATTPTPTPVAIRMFDVPTTTPAPGTAAGATPAPIPGMAETSGLLQPPGAPAPATPAPRTSVKITRPTMVALKFGSSTLPAGTMVPLVSVEGASAVIRFGPDLLKVPVANTDLETP